MTPYPAAREPEPVGLLVLGMHRSGTSATTGLLQRLGIPVSGELLPAESYNEKGIFENKSVNLFHNRLLAHLGSRWDDPMPVSNGFVETAAGHGFITELAVIIEAELLAGAPIFAVKDPRMSRFVPLWRAAMEVVGAEPQAILPLRHPLDVAASLARRDGFPRAKSLLLWLDHTLAGEAATRDLARSIVTYDALLADWRGTADRIAGDLGLRWPKERARAEAEIDTFLSADLRHHAASAAIGGETRLDALTAEAWDALTALAADAGDPLAQDRLDAVADTLRQATGVLLPYVAWEFDALNKASDDAHRLGAELAAQHREYAAADARAQDAIRASQDWAREALDAADKRSREALAAADKRSREALAAAHVAHSREIDERDGQLRALTAEAEPLRPLPAELHRAEHDISQLRHDLHAQRVAMEAIYGSTSWRALRPARALAARLPAGLRGALRGTARAGWSALTPWRMPARRRVAEARRALLEEVPPPPVPAEPLPAAPAEAAGPAEVPRLGQPALRIFETRSDEPRISLVTDSINAGSLFGGVATALIFAALLAERTGRRLRIVTRTQAPEAENVSRLFRAHGIDYAGKIDFAFADVAGTGAEIDVDREDLFITTSWWTTRSTAEAIAPERILHILQEDERMFYPFGDEALLCAETLRDGRIRKIVNSALLHRHLVADGIIDEATAWFEPAFPERIYHPEPAAGGKRRLFFYARPNNPRNLYVRGVETIERAIVEGVLDPDLWDIYFVGKDLAPLSLAGSVEPILRQNMAWEDYAALTRSVDLALTLMYTPHPSYPPLDIAACGGVAVTNRFGVKQDLSGYSRAILCADATAEALVEALRAGVALSLDEGARRAAFESNGLLRDWRTAFAPVLDGLTGDGRFVH